MVYQTGRTLVLDSACGAHNRSEERCYSNTALQGGCGRRQASQKVNSPYSFRSGLPGPKCFSITIGSDEDLFTILTPSLAAFSLTKNSSLVSCP